MGESTCLMHPLSYTSGISNEAKQVNPIHALGESISFGRFTTESLAWEKWSTFSQNQNRYVEEAERYAQPGSVAQKKAFFEAHYKRIAAKKAAALLEQANADTCHTPDPEVEDTDSPTMIVNEQQEVQTRNTKKDFVVNTEGYDSNFKPVEVGNVGGADVITEQVVLVENPVKNELLNQVEDFEDQNMVSGLEVTGTPLMEKPLLKNFNSNQDDHWPMSKKKPVLASLKSSVCFKASKVPSSPAKPKAPLHPRKDNNVTPATKKSAIDTTDRKRSTLKSLHMLMNFTPAREPERSTVQAIRKIETSRVAPSSYKTSSKDCATPLRTPAKASVNGVQKHPSTTPCSESRRAKTPLEPPASGSKTTGPKWHLLSAVCSKSLSACRKKLQSPTLSTPFILRTEERATRRKQKLEEKFIDNEAQKVQLQTRFKEKAETEIRKLRQSLCFKARPLPDFYRERETPKNQIKKTPWTQPQTPKLGRKANPSTMQSTISIPPPIPFTKNGASKKFLKNNGQTQIHSLASQPEMITHENTSPNIQH